MGAHNHMLLLFGHQFIRTLFFLKRFINYPEQHSRYNVNELESMASCLGHKPVFYTNSTQSFVCKSSWINMASLYGSSVTPRMNFIEMNLNLYFKKSTFV